MDTSDLLLAGEAPFSYTDMSAQEHCLLLTFAACAGDDSSWNMSDWQWDPVGFVAVPKLAQQATSSCCKKRKTINFLASERQPRPCGDCIEQGPLKLLQQASDSAGSNSCGNGADCKQQVTVSVEDRGQHGPCNSHWQTRADEFTDHFRRFLQLPLQSPAVLVLGLFQLFTHLPRAHVKQMDASVI